MSEKVFQFGEYIFKELSGFVGRLGDKGESDGLRPGDIVFTIAYGLLASVVSLYRSAGVTDAESKSAIRDMLNNMYSGDGNGKEES